MSPGWTVGRSKATIAGSGKLLPTIIIFFEAHPQACGSITNCSPSLVSTEKLTSKTAQAIYDQIAHQLTLAEFRPRALFERFNIEVLCTTDAATDTLEAHQAIRASAWNGQILPTFRPDALVNLDDPNGGKISNC